MRLHHPLLAAALAVSISPAAPAQITSLDLANYRFDGSFPLPAVAASEASAVAFNPDTGNLFVIGDEGTAIVEVTRTGALVSMMSLSGFDDTEGIAYVGGGQVVFVEERLQDVRRLTYVAGGSATAAGTPVASIGDTVGNVGLEGIAFEASTNQYFVVKEKTPQAVRAGSINFSNGMSGVADLFTPSLGVLDLSDVAVLSNVPSLVGTGDQDNLLIYSQESFRLMEVSRSGAILSQFDFTSLSGSAEGVTIDNDGVIYIVDESPTLFVLRPIPEPAGALAIVSFIACSIRRRRI